MLPARSRRRLPESLATNRAYLAARLKRLGVPVHAARSGALAALAYRIPPPVLADLLGLSPKTTAKASEQLKVDYAGYVARRTRLG